MKTQDIELLFEYSDWANQRILTAAEQLSFEQLTAANPFGWGSLRGALVHIMEAEYRWRCAFTQTAPRGEMEPADFPNIAALRTRWHTENQALWAYLKGLSDADLQGLVKRERGGRQYAWPLWQCLLHLVNHGTQHRSECAALLTAAGTSPGDMDLIVFLNSR